MKKISKAERRLLLSSLGAMSLLGGVALFRISINATPQVSIPPYPIAPNPNGYSVYLQAAQIIVRANPPVSERSDPKPPTDEKLRAQRYSLSRKEAWLRQNAAGFSLFQKALNMKCLPPKGRSDESPWNGQFRELARSKLIERQAREMRGDWSEAARSGLDVVQMGTAISSGETRNGLIGIGVQAIGREDCWKHVDRLNASEARNALSSLQAIYDGRSRYSQTVQEEKWSALTRLQGYLNMASWRSNDWWFLRPKPSFVEKTKMFALSKQAIVDETVQAFDTAIADAKQPYNSPKKQLPLTNPITQTLVSTNYSMRCAFARNDAANAMWLVALALHAYKLERKSYPPTLRVLVGAYLKAIPADPFGGGEALRYKRDGDTYVLWSVGPDMRDNDGAAIPHEKNDSSELRKKLARVQPDSKGDYVWGKNQ